MGIAGSRRSEWVWREEAPTRCTDTAAAAAEHAAASCAAGGRPSGGVAAAGGATDPLALQQNEANADDYHR